MLGERCRIGSMRWRRATVGDAPLLADMNRQLREDEAPLAEPLRVDFESRMLGWLSGEYSAVLFELNAVPVAYALWRDHEGRGVYLRQFFVARDRRRQGLGRRAIELLVSEVLPPGTDVTLEVLDQNPTGLAFWRALGFCSYARTLLRASQAALVVRLIGPDDDWSMLTELLHRAYAALAARGLRFYASHQDESATRERAGEGECFVAVQDGKIVGTVTALPGGRESKSSWYQRPDTASMGQLAVDPPYQGRGIGRALMERAERRAVERGAQWIAIDTSERAVELIATYRRRGYEIVESVKWDVTNYQSVVLAKRL